jgi:hypothetical protein
LGNRFYIPDSAPRHPLGGGNTGEIYFSGVSRFIDNQFRTDNTTNPANLNLRVSYDQTQLATTVLDDVFPFNGSVYPVSYPNDQPLSLNEMGALNIP